MDVKGTFILNLLFGLSENVNIVIIQLLIFTKYFLPLFVIKDSLFSQGNEEM